MSPAQRYIKTIVEHQGWRLGSTLENRIALWLGKSGLGPQAGCVQQYSVGRYRLDFAWPDIQVALEADGWHHLRPESAARDAERDRWLRKQGWLVFRVDDDPDDGVIAEQVVRVAVVLHQLLETNRWRRQSA